MYFLNKKSENIELTNHRHKQMFHNYLFTFSSNYKQFHSKYESVQSLVYCCLLKVVHILRAHKNNLRRKVFNNKFEYSNGYKMNDLVLKF